MKKTTKRILDIRGKMEEWNCDHGVGHHQGVHGCDGCCSKKENEEVMKKTSKE